MKFKKFLFATMVAVAFTACNESNDPVVTPEPDPAGDGKTYLAVAIDQVKTRAAEDNKLNSLAVIVANEEGEIELIQTNKGTIRPGEEAETPIPPEETGLFEVLEGVKQIMVIANVEMPESIEVGDNLSEVAETYISLSDEGEENLSMNSGIIYEIILPAGTRNYLGYSVDRVNAIDDATNAYVRLHLTGPVKLYRNVAKVVINSIGMSDAWLENSTYKNPSFELDSVTVFQTHGYSALASLNEWGSTNVAPTDAMPWVTPLAAALLPGLGLESSKWVKASPLEGDFSNEALRLKKEFPTGITVGYGGAKYAPAPEEALELYVYENTATEEGNETLVSISGTFSYDYEGQRVTEPIKRRYAFAVGKTGVETGYGIPSGFDAELAGRTFAEGNAIGVLRNLKYVVDLNITGKGGGDDPWRPDEKAELDVTVQVVEWGAVNQVIDVD